MHLPSSFFCLRGLWSKAFWNEFCSRASQSSSCLCQLLSCRRWTQANRLFCCLLFSYLHYSVAPVSVFSLWRGSELFAHSSDLAASVLKRLQCVFSFTHLTHTLKKTFTSSHLNGGVQQIHHSLSPPPPPFWMFPFSSNQSAIIHFFCPGCFSCCGKGAEGAKQQQFRALLMHLIM